MLRCPYFMFVVHIFPLFFLKTILDVIGLGWPLWTNTTCYGSPSVAPLSIGCPCPNCVCLVFLFIYLFYFYMWHSLFHWWIIRVASWDLLGPFGIGVATWLDLSSLEVMLLRSLRKWPCGVFWLVYVTSVPHCGRKHLRQCFGFS